MDPMRILFTTQEVNTVKKLLTTRMRLLMVTLFGNHVPRASLCIHGNALLVLVVEL